MNKITADMNIAIIEARDAIKEIDSIEDRLKKAMEITRNHWMCTDEEKRLWSAVGAVLVSYGVGTQEFERLEKEIKCLKRFNAAISAASTGLSVDFGGIVENDEDFKPIGIVKMWHEVNRQ